jgi:hypothetical protein
LTQQILLLQTALEPDVQYLIRSAVWSASVGVILLKLEKFFRCDGIACSIEKDRIHFIDDPFRCIPFQIKPQKGWSLTFFKPNFSEVEHSRPASRSG